MHVAGLAYSLGGISLALSVIATVVHGRRFSGRTLFQQDSKHSSVDFHSPGARKSSLEYGRLRNQSDAQRDSRDSSSIHAEDRPAPRKIQRTPSEIKRSLDSLMLQPSSGRTSPAASTIQVETPRMPPAPKLNLPADESNIHPLFRSNSVSPPPTPMPGTTLHASPAAGQTISVKTLSRVRSVNSLRSPGSRSRSPLFERMDHDGEMNQEQGTESRMDNQLKGEGGNAIPGFIMAADVRRSITRYEKRYDLHESPDES
ncbi:uncharacterized protein ACLA_009300 [Aspergillus clavatus NRRL 1]|uniref:Uncharacterized protein n=1 Tax=Aspergillus clavatus (strain ATCC 1007 / CBS 513.65 / DSM 816 / NCTC 3887 / NRRL 1 / QM 1276 / 107) TaxID=344612 RepID=A1C9U2_ASPCL|nr:uncharacterized protein ACLA_009300 [Aspergillus clavatus NRRL 1]EAW12510.1 conserved hypothetical protein [Aspergillus clavatus NRRL 1]